MHLTQSVDAAELDQIEREWGAAPRQHHRLQVDHPFLTGDGQLLVSDRRRGEICYVMHRGRPDDGLLLHIKTFYPLGAFRLPTGGIHQGEGVEETLAREITEETGLTVGKGADTVRVQKYLGVLSYEFQHTGLQQQFDFATYCWLVQMPIGAVLNPQDPAEQIGGWQWCGPGELIAVAEKLESVGDSTPDWGDWGVYRGLGHRFVAAALA
ncbi:MAG: NUDIX hydrolase [Caldilineaceae bacterium]|nr:NUDIX hydrolase [Caldilineaceae bacterium]